MSTDEPSRHRLLLRLQQVLGEEEAATLMERLPPDRWDELARREDVDGLAGRFRTLEGRFDTLEGRFDTLEGRFDTLEGRFEILEGRVQTLEHEVRDLRKDMVHGFATVDLRFEELERRLELRFDRQRDELVGVLHDRIDRQTRALLFTFLAAIVTMALVSLSGG
jgi:predicted nuclease with TOPRIM domain